ncbi:Sec-independent protein translocase subunit TatA [Micrococcoides hystricis]|uniref:Sec-independent protein translocase protein TatA n=1 Tax=Micrococcoides hystricis TaxID=1572761 RepID=A0ABV6P7A1_9MICC
MGLQGYQWIIILVIILLLFGAPKLPALARSLGQSMRIFKSEVKQMGKDEDKKDPNAKDDNNQNKVVEGRVLDADDTTSTRKNDPTVS